MIYKMLHIHNGDASAEIAKQSTLPGEHFAWREALIDGPTPANVKGDEWRKLRANHLSNTYEIGFNEVENELRSQEQKLSTSSEHDEVILWFEHDLFCQVNLLYLLDCFAQRELGKTKLSLIFVGEFPGVPNFRGLGELSPEQIGSLFPKRQEVSLAQLTIARAAWDAYCSPDPAMIETLLKTDTSAMPFLNQAFRLHLERYPSVSNGLGRIQNRSLEFIQSGLHKFAEMFGRFVQVESSYGLGDAQFWLALKQMADARQPLLKTDNGGSSNGKLGPEGFSRVTFELTDAGAEVLSRQSDFVELNGVDLWLGGVHLSGKKDLWRWDDRSQQLVFR